MDSPLDFSHVTSEALAVQLLQQSKLEKCLLFPRELGGEEVPENVVYVPVGLALIRDHITGMLVRMVKDDLINKLEVRPEYKGNSFVPSRIVIKAWHSGKPGGFEPTIHFW